MLPSISMQISSAPPLATPVWVDLPGRLIGFSGFHGRGSELEDVPAGTGTLHIDNSDGAFDRDNPSSPYAALLTTNRRVRVNAPTTQAIDQFVDFWPMDDDPTFEERTVTVTTHDSLGMLADRDIKPAKPFTLDDPVLGVLDAGNLLGGVPSFPPALSGARIRTILELVGWPDELIDVDDGVSGVAADVGVTDKVLPYLQRIARSEVSPLFATSGNVVTFRARRAWTRIAVQNVSQATFTDNPAILPGLPYEDLVLDPGSKALIKNSVTRAAGPRTFTAMDLTSQGDYGTIEDNQTDLLNAAIVDLIGNAQYTVERYKNGIVRITAITVNWLDDPSLITLMQLVDIGWRLTIGRTPQLGNPFMAVRECNVESVEHDSAAPSTWTTTWGLIEADLTPYFTLDDPVLGVLDAGNKLAF